jgi:hypothetical protein
MPGIAAKAYRADRIFNIFTSEQVTQMMDFAQERVTWKSSPSRTESILCVYREGRTFTIDRVQRETEHGIEVYNRIPLTGAERKKLFAKIASTQKKIAKLIEKND